MQRETHKPEAEESAQRKEKRRLRISVEFQTTIDIFSRTSRQQWHTFWLRVTRDIFSDTRNLSLRQFVCHTSFHPCWLDQRTNLNLSMKVVRCRQLRVQPFSAVRRLNQSRWLVCNSIAFGILNDNSLFPPKDVSEIRLAPPRTPCRVTSHDRSVVDRCNKYQRTKTSWERPCWLMERPQTQTNSNVLNISRVFDWKWLAELLSRVNILRQVLRARMAPSSFGRRVFSTNQHRRMINGESANCAARKALSLT